MKPQPLDLEGIKEKVLRKVGWDEKMFNSRKELFFGKRGVYKDKDGFIREYPKRVASISIEYFSELHILHERIVEATIKEILQRLKSACEFYLRYKSNWTLFAHEQPELAEEFSWNPKYDIMEFNEWLFKLAFKGVLEDET